MGFFPPGKKEIPIRNCQSFLGSMLNSGGLYYVYLSIATPFENRKPMNLSNSNEFQENESPHFGSQHVQL